ncbi:uncharacterized protein JCM6883_006452 [Sporobolomyces salmoneus]|uniref:uncharacterized protein n=1 Tax=Sporobolomyces salmoneus TaxID=183962 RepID=UPI0031742CA3
MSAAKEAQMMEHKEEVMLPPPVTVAFVPPGTSSKLKVRWAKLKRRIGNGSAPSESLGDPTNTTGSDSGSSFGRNRPASQRWKEGEEKHEEADEIDEVVVEQSEEYDCWKKVTIASNSASHRAGGGTGTSPGTGLVGTMASDDDSLRQTTYEANGPLQAVYGFARYRIYPQVSRFFNPSYHDKTIEEAYQKESWYTSKSRHLFGSLYLVLNWVLTLALLPRPFNHWNEAHLYAVMPVLTVPLVVLAAFDIPRRKPWIWQLWVFSSIWVTGTAFLIDMHSCGFYTATPHCGGKDYMSSMYYAISGPTIALFAMNMKRILAFLFSATWLITVSITILPIRHAWARNVVLVILFHAFLMSIHYMAEMAERRLFTLRAELKVQYRAKQRAQINERKTMDAKRRFSSYIFHEVRVPLNTALLAVQNLKGLNVFNANSDNAIEYSALEGSLQMMSQVLNDVLDFSRMERGGFSSVSRPFSLHNLMRSIFVPLRLDAAARGLELETSLDSRVDELARLAAYPDQSIENIREGDGILMGDEMRLRQIIGNLISNACKFTPSGGKLTINTKLIYPVEIEKHQSHLPNDAELSPTDFAVSDATSETYSPRLSAGRLQQHESEISPQSKEMLVVRFEIKDTGIGIRPAEIAEHRLFSPYVQTDVGRMQGGKGTGLGLSLVRQIVMLSGGRLGVQSKVGQGSTFWVELPFAIGLQTREGGDFADPNKRSSKSPGNLTPCSKDKDISPLSDSSASDYRFVSSLRDPTAISVDESPDRTRTSSVSTATSPSSPVRKSFTSDTESRPMIYGQASSGESTIRGNTSPTEEHPAFTSLAADQPFALDPPHRPEPYSHISTQSAPANVTLPSSPLSIASAPVVTSVPSTPALSSVPKPTKFAPPKLEFPDGPLRVLVVDDDNLTRRLMGRMMSRLGCAVESAENGKIALDMMLAPEPGKEGEITEIRDGDAFDAEERGEMRPHQKKKTAFGIDPRSGVDAHKNFDIVFLDNQMPVMSGVQLGTKLRALGRDDLVVGVTANALLSDQEQYLEQGASFVLTKPVSEDSLKKYLFIADRRRAEALHPELKLQREAEVLGSNQ